MVKLRIAGMVLVLLIAATASATAAGLPDGAVIEKLTGLKGTANENEGVFKVLMPRSDLSAKVAGAKITPPMGLTCWAAFIKAGDATMVMGDIVLLEDQIDAVMDAALHNGLEVTALHNHFTFDTPRIMFMHIGGVGRDEDLAAAVGRVFAAVRDTAGGKGKVPTTDIDPAQSKLSTNKLEEILGKGEFKNGVFKVTIGRTTKMHGHDVGKEMGINTWAAFAGTDSKAVVDGDFAMLEPELQEVLKTLRRAGIGIVAIHNHMTHEEPRIMFLHFWGTGNAELLANGIKGALAKTAAGKR
ncbi:DUF1259 domain-containing protein [Geobacter sp. AOG1]|uniref:DUF1259 domain-containing protein n=1 Tax=Geobacter sp. AOG1 TaxID=1566346 RepID=UPI001CC67AFE|nr:DUF1259 domain-containing protein [Geobacter sp. AOG1]GFE57575.1 peptidoglycan-binding protein LysM [Geobacter sp. AOG1]